MKFSEFFFLSVEDRRDHAPTEQFYTRPKRKFHRSTSIAICHSFGPNRMYFDFDCVFNVCAMENGKSHLSRCVRRIFLFSQRPSSHLPFSLCDTHNDNQKYRQFSHIGNLYMKIENDYLTIFVYVRV